MATIDWPVDLTPSKATWGLQSNTETFVSPLNRSTQTVERPGARWKATLEFPHMERDKRRRLEGFLAGLGGMAGRFFLWPHTAPVADLAAVPVDETMSLNFLNQIYQVNGNVVVDGTVTDFKALPTKYWPPNTLVLKAGEYLAAGGELKMATADVYSDLNGWALVPIAPAFRKAPPNLSVVTLTRPTTTMMLSSDEYGVAVMPGFISDTVIISAVEVF
ncbi:hypothetical protein C7414_102381 [Cupriavidus alkaliphilus]|uniref:hypothetical protein n=1 Tax=Cupriavidus alkaliphilus TaxID=942866 RepID=UPI000DE69BD1|nr:hypothetical protein [Cupriavidus alkaliphilus]PVY81053.1 hypothetical protein C7414_102381 [Cupriavidus alkaliphilus]